MSDSLLFGGGSWANLDLRERICAYVAEGNSARSAGRLFGVSAATAVRLAALHREHGTAVPKPQGRPAGQFGKLARYRDFLLETALTAFDFGIEQTLFESLEADFGAHMYISSNQLMWSDSTETITLSTDATLSAQDDTQRTAQITNLSAQNDAVELTYSSAGQADVDLIWTPTSLKLNSVRQTAEWAQTPSTKY